MRALLFLLTACSAVQVQPPPDGPGVTADAAEDAGAYADPCELLASGDDPLCTLACSDFPAFAALATVGHCAVARCSLTSGGEYDPRVCVDPG